MVRWLAEAKCNLVQKKYTQNIDPSAQKGDEEIQLNSSIDNLLVNVFVQRP